MTVLEMRWDNGTGRNRCVVWNANGKAGTEQLRVGSWGLGVTQKQLAGIILKEKPGYQKIVRQE